MTSLTLETLPEPLQEIVETFQFAEDKQERLEMLVEYAKELPKLPAHFAGQVDRMEQVHECQSPFFLVSEVNEGKVNFYYEVPMEAPTIRGYASILAQGTARVTPEEVLQIPTNFYLLMGLNEVISPLRLRGVEAVVARMKRQMQEYLASYS